MLKKSLLIPFVLWSSLLANCATSPPDVPVCTEIHQARGWCTNTITDVEFFVDDTNKLEGKTWWELRPFMIQVPITSWVKIKAYIQKTCKKTKMCEEEIYAWERKMQDLDQQLEEKGAVAPAP